MPLAAAKCTNCGASLRVDNTKDAAVCPYCGTPYIVEKAINHFNTTNNINANIVNIYGENSADFVIRTGVLEKYNGADTNVVIPNSVTSIGNRAFSGCRGLTDVIIPDSVIEIGYSAFADCVSLNAVIIPDSVTSIKSGAFRGCRNLSRVTLSANVTEIEQEVFHSCTSLTEITLPDSVTLIKKEAFENCTSLTDITIPGSVLAIREGAFSGCSSLTSLTIPDSVVEIGGANYSGPGTFSGCSRLTHITLPHGIASINYETFNGCSSLADIIIPENITKIGVRTFKGCSRLVSVTIPASVTQIEYGAFESCTSLTNIAFLGGSTTLEGDLDNGRGVFWGCERLATISPVKYLDRYPYAFSNCPGLKDFLTTKQPSTIQTPNIKATSQKNLGRQRSGCYIATAVYGSYDCPKVRVLRRFRDTILAKTVFGQLFIRFYYAVSPTVVRLFGNQQWFSRFWKKHLDRLVEHLMSNGFEDTSYFDK